jgi:AcrR family transcriptional regulator
VASAVIDPEHPDESLTGADPNGGRERVLRAAYDLFSRNGVRAVGIDAVVDQAAVAKMTLYRHFPSKDDLVLAFLDRRDEVWTRGWLQAETARRASTPQQQLLAIFDVFSEWFARADFEGCSFINVMLEIADPKNLLHISSVQHLAGIRAFLAALAAQAGVEDSEAFSRQWHILMKGSIVAAGEGDLDAAARAKHLGRLLLAHHGIPDQEHSDDHRSRPGDSPKV